MKKNWETYVRTFENLLSESKIQSGGCFAPYSLGSLLKTFKVIKITKLNN
jgi:hypothetical protein